MTRNPLSELIRGLARADWDEADALVMEIGQGGWTGSLCLIRAAFALAVNDHFGAHPTPNDVAAWVAATRAQYHDGDALPALEMESLVRAALGEPELVDNIPVERSSRPRCHPRTTVPRCEDDTGRARRIHLQGGAAGCRASMARRSGDRRNQWSASCFE
ncbi:hypothetical protein AB0J84_15465 [Micromonospora arborensis]|uniref:hypothetical protein n=1 Tax=Micromonospora arborensis TaxID=2116518 RepID=UPI00341D3999